MEQDERDLLKHLLTLHRVASLAVLVDGKPFASMVPFALTEDGTAALIHASSLARHSAGLQADAPFAILIHELDNQAQKNPAQLGRITLAEDPELVAIHAQTLLGHLDRAGVPPVHGVVA